MADHPYPGARACPICWESQPDGGRFTATFNYVTHRSQECGETCLRHGIGAWNIDAFVEFLRDCYTGSREAPTAPYEERRWEALAEQEARGLEEALGVPVEVGMTLGELKARVQAARGDES
jgi:hypothetical protein